MGIPKRAKMKGQGSWRLSRCANASVVVGITAASLAACGPVGDGELTAQTTQAEGFWQSDCAVFPAMTNNGGPVIPSATVVMVLWERSGGATFDPSVQSWVPAFYSHFVNDFSWLAEYSSGSNQVIGAPGGLMGIYRITPSASAGGTLLNDSAFGPELAAQVNNKHLPAPTASTIYAIHLPKEVQAFFPGTKGTTCGSICGYHSFANSGGYTFHYTVIADLSDCRSACLPGHSVADSETLVASHEIDEAVTDPEGVVSGPAWKNAVSCVNAQGVTLNEIGDVCESKGTYLQNEPYLVSTNWSRRELSCVGPGLSSPAEGNPAPNVLLTKTQTSIGLQTFNNTSYTYVPLGQTTSDVFELNSLTNSATDISATSGAAAASTAHASVAAFLDSQGFNDRVYRDVNGDIQIIQRAATSSGWSHTDLSSYWASHGGLFANTGPISAYRRADGINSMVTLGAGAHANHILEFSLAYSSTTTPIWIQSDLSNAAGAGPSAAAAGSPYGFIRMDAVDAVVYVGTDGHIHELSLAPAGRWKAQDISGTLPSAVAGSLHAYNRTDQVSSIVYRGADGNIYELYLIGCSNGLPCPTEQWGLGNLSGISGAPPAASDPVGFVDPFALDSVAYFATSGDLIQIGFLEGALPTWESRDFTTFTVPFGNNKGPVPTWASGQEFGAATTNVVTRFVYMAPNNHLIEVWYGPFASTPFWNDVTINNIASGL